MSLLSRASRTLAPKLVVGATKRATPAVAAAARSITTHSQLPEEHQMIYDMCRRFADEEIAPNAAKWDQKHEFPDKVKDMVCLYLYLCVALLGVLLLFFMWAVEDGVFFVVVAGVNHMIFGRSEF